MRHAQYAPEHDRDLFDRVFRRGNQAERLHIAKFAHWPRRPLGPHHQRNCRCRASVRGDFGACRFSWSGEKKTEKATRPRRSRLHPAQQRSVARRGVLGLEKVTEPLFLAELAHALEGALMHGIHVARRLGWSGEDELWRIGELHRVYPAYVEEPGHRPREPDEYNEGVAPSAKLLFVTVSRLGTLDPAAAQVFLERWRQGIR